VRWWKVRRRHLLSQWSWARGAFSELDASSLVAEGGREDGWWSVGWRWGWGRGRTTDQACLLCVCVSVDCCCWPHHHHHLPSEIIITRRSERASRPADGLIAAGRSGDAGRASIRIHSYNHHPITMVASLLAPLAYISVLVVGMLLFSRYQRSRRKGQWPQLLARFSSSAD
jgi:hypothetical protein